MSSLARISHPVSKEDFLLNGLQSRTEGGSSINWNLHSLKYKSIIKFSFYVIYYLLFPKMTSSS